MTIKYGLLTAVLLLGLGACKKQDSGIMPQPEPNGLEQPVHIPISSITLSHQEKGLSVGESFTLTASLLPTDASNTKVKFQSDKEDIASVSPEGVVTAKAVGNAIITALGDGNKVATCLVRVTPVRITVESISLNLSEKTINEGEHFELTATIRPEGATEQAVQWASDKPEIANVSSTGTVRGIKAGEATITATSVDGDKVASCKVTVNRLAIPVASISLNHSSYRLTQEQTVQLTASISPDDADDKQITWSSDKEDIASVSSNGLVTAHKVGRATITARSGNNKSATCTIEVTARHIAVTSISLNKANHSMKVGEHFDLSVNFTPQDASNQSVTWQSSQADVASVLNGRVTALKAGTTTITATSEDGQKKATCAITVNPNIIAVTGVQLNHSFLDLKVGESKQLSATITPSNASNKELHWESDMPNTATVNEQGLVTAKGVGVATITVKTADGKHSASCTVTITPSNVQPNPVDPLLPNPSDPITPVDPNIPGVQPNPPSNDKAVAITFTFTKANSKLRFEDGSHFERDSFIDLNNNGQKDNDEGIFNNKDYTISGTSCNIYGGASSVAVVETSISKVSSNGLKSLKIKHNNSEHLSLECINLEKFEAEHNNSRYGNLKTIDLSKVPSLVTFKAEYAKIETLDFKKTRNIKEIWVRKNSITGNNAENMFNSLPSHEGTIYFLTGKRDTNNTASTSAVNALKAKGWQIKRGNGSYADYEGV